MAWASWMHREFGKTFFPERLTVWDKWPPIDGSMAAAVVSDLKSWRSDANKAHITGPILPEINSAPRLWQPWPIDEIQALERDEARWRADAGSSFLQRPRYSWEG